MKYIKVLILSLSVLANSSAIAFNLDTWYDTFRKESEQRLNEQKRFYAKLQRQDRMVLIALGVFYGILLKPFITSYLNRLHDYLKWTFGSNETFQKDFDHLLKELVWLDEQFSNSIYNMQDAVLEYELTRAARLCGYKLGANKKPVHAVVENISDLFEDIDAYYQSAKKRNVSPSMPETDYIKLKQKLKFIKTELIKSIEFSSENRELIIKSSTIITHV
jgi:hypothetical protein